MTVHHVSLETRPEEAETAASFWALLGFERVEPPSALRDRVVWVQRGSTQVHLLFVDDPVVMPEGHVAVVAGDYDGALQRLEDAGFTVEPRAEHWGAPRCYVTAPGGHRVEVMAFPPPG